MTDIQSIPTKNETYASSQSALFEHVITFFEQEQIPYCVVGDTRQLPEQIDGDVDFVVEQGTIGDVPRRLSEFCQSRGLYLPQVIQHESTAYFCVVADEDAGGRFRFIQADICGDYYRNGKRFLRAEELLAHRIPARDENGRAKGFYVSAPAEEFIYYFLKKVDKQQLDEKQGSHLSRQWNKDPAGCRQKIARFWPPRFQDLIAHASEHDNWNSVRQLFAELKETLHKGWSPSLGAHRREIQRMLTRISEPSGLWISVMGPDGSGKSSVCHRLLDDIAPAFWDTEYVHLRPKLGLSRDDGAQPAVTDPHGKPVRSGLSSILKNLYYLADYNLGHVWDVRPRLIRSQLVVFDRYFHDMMVDPKRYRYGGPSSVVQWSSNLLPTPDLFLFLDAPASILHQRKKEVSFEETRRQRHEYRRLAEQLDNALLLDAAQPLDRVVAAAERRILEYLSERTAERFDAEVVTND